MLLKLLFVSFVVGPLAKASYVATSDSEGGEMDLSSCGEGEGEESHTAKDDVYKVARANGGRYSTHLSQGLR